MGKRVFIEEAFGLARLAVLEGERLVEIKMQESAPGEGLGGIYLGRVQNALKGINAAFVDIGLEKSAYLYAKEAALTSEEAAMPITRFLRPGDYAIVQVQKEAYGQKGARLTRQISLAGHLMVLEPFGGRVGASKRIRDEQRRAALRRRAMALLPEGLGLIVRTEAEKASEESFAAELRQLLGVWEGILEAKKTQTPRLLYDGDSFLRTALREHFGEETERFTVAGEGLFAEARRIVGEFAPSRLERLKKHESALPLFDFHGIEKQIDEALRKRIKLPGGGEIVIEETEALTVIDVNSARFMGSGGLEDTALRTNLDAAREIARQLRLRDIGGVVVIDFIDMAVTENRGLLLNALREALKGDKTPSFVEGMTKLGLVEMTRRRGSARLSAHMAEPCPVCGGSGQRTREDQLARKALREFALKSSGGGAFEIAARPRLAEQIERLKGEMKLTVRAREGLDAMYRVVNTP
ncbi:MAG: Rne/Rng family ribonuclease [Christensenellaceae bacterium]|nr:Rne/Rng family ribonuclease [Christensenellaceae bacterium]